MTNKERITALVAVLVVTISFSATAFARDFRGMYTGNDIPAPAPVSSSSGDGIDAKSGNNPHSVAAPSPAGVDTTPSAKERQKAKHYAAVEASNKRAEMHLDLQNLIEDGVVEMTQSVYDGIKDALPYVTAERKASGKIQICPKEQIKAVIGHSPDVLDSVLLSIHAAIRFLGDTAYAIP